ncbi:hypothetical protein ASZ90_019380 [hydrocarbon metagenome]|uniref:Uncharacterized protein n=1 Tax=hydrocarbon metagenome TaxID=938273 RepID=A0A0W8E4F3_9ZZZZ
MFKFDKSKLEQQASKIVQKSGDMVESGKIKLNITNLEKEINSLKSGLGNTLYNAFKAGNNAEAELTAICNQIDEKYHEIDALQTQLEGLKTKE